MDQTKTEQPDSLDTQTEKAMGLRGFAEEKVGKLATGIADFIPGVGEVLAAGDVVESAKKGDIVGTAVNTAALALGIVPVVGDIAGKGLKAGLKASREGVSPLRSLFNKLPKKDKDALPSQPNETGLYGYHGTARERGPDEPFFDIGFGRKQDQFLGEGFYFTLDPKVAEEYANMRALDLGRSAKTARNIKGQDAIEIMNDPKATHVGASRSTNPRSAVVNVDTAGNFVTPSSIMGGTDIYGNPLSKGQSVARFDLSGLEKPFVVKNNKDRKYLKENFQKLKDEGYDSVLFSDFEDRSKQIMVFPEHIGKVTGDTTKDITDIVDDFVRRPEIKIEVPTYKAAGTTEEKATKWKADPKNQNPFKKELEARNPELEELAKGVREGRVFAETYRKKADLLQPIKKIEELKRHSSVKDIAHALDAQKAKNGIVGLNVNIPDGARISARLDIPAYTRYDVWIPSVQSLGNDVLPKGKMVYSPTVVLKDVKFIQPEGTQPMRALNVAEGGQKGPYAVMEGSFINATDESAFSKAKEVFDSDEWTQVGYDPTRRGFFYNRATGEPVLEASEVIQVGALVLAKNAKLGDAAAFAFNKGGIVSMDNQTEMAFMENGGLQDDGATLDPVSGNEVPAGSMDQEVRDDIPARLSEGEYVVPADVVRYFGVKFFEDLRTEAKRGMGQMDADGRIGGEPIPEEDNEELPIPLEEVQMMAEGGVVKAANGVDMPPTSTFSYTPNTRYGSASQAFGVQFREFTNPDAGRTITIPFFNGQPMTIVPQGFIPAEQAASQAQTGDTTAPAPADGGGSAGPTPYIGTGSGNMISPSSYTTGEDFLAGMESNTGILATIAGFSPILGSLGKMNHDAGVKRANELVTQHTQSPTGTLTDFDLIAMGAYALTPPKSGPSFFSGIASLLTGKGSEELKEVEVFYQHPLYGPLLEKVGDKTFTYNKSIGKEKDGNYQRTSTGTIDQLLELAKSTLPAVQQNRSQVEGLYDNSALAEEGGKKGVAQRSFESTGHVLTNYGSMTFVPNENNVRSLDIFRVQDGSGKTKMFRRSEIEELTGKKNLTSKDLLEFDPTKYTYTPTGEKGLLGEDKMEWKQTGVSEGETTEPKTGGKTPPPMDELVTPFETTTQPSQMSATATPPPDYATMGIGEAGRGPEKTGVATGDASGAVDMSYNAPLSDLPAELGGGEISSNLSTQTEDAFNFTGESAAQARARLEAERNARRQEQQQIQNQRRIDREQQRNFGATSPQTGLGPAQSADRDVINDAMLREAYIPVQDPFLTDGVEYDPQRLSALPAQNILQPEDDAPVSKELDSKIIPPFTGTGLETTPDVSTEEFEPIVPSEKPTLTEPPVSAGEGQPPVEIGDGTAEQMVDIEMESDPIFSELMFHEASVTNFEDVLNSPTVAAAGGIRNGIDGKPLGFVPYQVGDEEGLTLGPGIYFEPGEIDTTKVYSPEEVRKLFVQKVNESKRDVASTYGTDLPPDINKALVGMRFNLGAPRLGGFDAMNKAIKSKDFANAALNVIQTGKELTPYAEQVGDRANYYAALMLGMKPDIKNPPDIEEVRTEIVNQGGSVPRKTGTIDDDAKRKKALEDAKKKNAEAIAARNAEKEARRREKQRERNRKQQDKARADANKKQKDKTVYTGGGAGSGSGIALKSGGLVKRRSNKKGKK